MNNNFVPTRNRGKEGNGQDGLFHHIIGTSYSRDISYFSSLDTVDRPTHN